MKSNVCLFTFSYAHVHFWLKIFSVSSPSKQLGSEKWDAVKAKSNLGRNCQQTFG
jgi:hypothetical protein